MGLGSFGRICGGGVEGRIGMEIVDVKGFI